MKIPLNSGAYQNRSLIANAQRSVNAYCENNPEESDPESPFTHYVRPGNRPLGAPAVPGRGRGIFRVSNGDLYGVAGPNVISKASCEVLKFLSLGINRADLRQIRTQCRAPLLAGCDERLESDSVSCALEGHSDALALWRGPALGAGCGYPAAERQQMRAERVERRQL